VRHHPPLDHRLAADVRADRLVETGRTDDARLAHGLEADDYREWAGLNRQTRLVSETMRARVLALPCELTAADARRWLESNRARGERRGQQLYPLVDREGRLTGVMTRSELAALGSSLEGKPEPGPAPIVAYPNETLRAVAERMASRHTYVLPVVAPGTGKLLGLIHAEDVLRGRARAYDRENKHERMRAPFRRMKARTTGAAGEAVKETV
jgi:CBS domain-containing protein